MLLGRKGKIIISSILVGDMCIAVVWDCTIVLYYVYCIYYLY